MNAIRTPKNSFVVRMLMFVAPLLVLSGCFDKYIMTDSEVAAHYKNRKVQPNFQFDTLENGRKMYFAEVGADTLPLILFVHGAPGAWYGYMNYLDDSSLQKRYHLIAVDRLGYGKSDYGKPVTSIRQQAEALHDLIAKKRNGKPVIVIGRSYGGPISAALALHHPDDVNALILLAPALDPAHEKFWWFSKPANSKIIRWMLPKAINVASDEKFSHQAELTLLMPELTALKTPVTIVQGSADQIVDTANFYFARKVLPPQNAHFIWLPGEDHFIAAHRPDLVKQLINTYSDSLQTAH